MKKPLVSAITCVYNGERFLKETINSIINQTYENIEIIIVDDSSTDESRAIIESYSDPRIKAIFKGKNENLCCAFGTALKEATGEYCAIVGHDDVWMPNKTERQIKYMEAHKECVACFTRCNVIDQNSKIINEQNELFSVFNSYSYITRHQHMEALYTMGNYLCGPSVVVRTKELKKLGGYDYSFLQYQDYDLWLRLLVEGDLYILEEKLVNYRQIRDTNTNISARNDKTERRSVHEKYHIQDYYLDYLPDRDFVLSFRKYFMNPNAESKEELLCEKMFLLKKKKNPYWTKRCIALLNDETCRNILDEKYHFTAQDFYKCNSEIIFGEPALYEYLNKSNTQMKRYREIVEKKAVLLNPKQTAAYLDFLFELIKQDEEEKAKELFFSEILNIYIDSEVETFKLLLKVSEQEKQNNEEKVFQGKSSLKDVFLKFNKLKFLLRRYDFDVEDTETSEELLRFIAENNVSGFLLTCVTDNSIIHRIKVLNKVAMFLFDAEERALALHLLRYAYKQSQDVDTSYNLAAVLLLSGYRDMAEKIASKIDSNEERVLELKAVIQGEL